MYVFFLIKRQPPRSTLLPYTTLFRSGRLPAPVEPGLRTTRGREGRAAPRRTRPSHPRKPEAAARSEEHTSELQSRQYLVCCLLLEKKTFIIFLLHTTLLLFNFPLHFF